MDYQSGMSKVQAISGATGDEMELLGAKAMEMAAKTKFSTADSAEAYQYMAMAGWKTGDMLDGLSGIMNLAAASGENLGTTSDIVTDAITAFGLTAADSGRFADVLAAASNNANTNVSMLGESFKYVAPVLGGLGYSIEDTSVALGLMANSGIKASMAGTSLKTLITNMSKPTKDMQSAMDALGVSLNDDEGNMYSLMEVIEQLRKGFGGGSMSSEEFSKKIAELDGELESGSMSQEDYAAAVEKLAVSMYGAEGAQKAELAAMLAGKEGMSGLLAIVNTAPEDFNKLTEAIYSANGTAEEMARIMQDNAAGAFERLKSAVDVLFTKLSEHLLPIFTSIVEKVTDVVNWFGELDSGTQKLILTIGGIAAAAGPVLIVIGNIITAVSQIGGAISGLIGVVQNVSSAVSGLFAILAANPIAAVIAAVAALVAGLIVLWNTNEDFRNAVGAIWEAITGFFQAAVDTIKAAWEGVAEFFSGIWEAIQSAFSGVAEFFGGIFEVAAGLVRSAWEAIVDFFRGVWEGIQSIFTTVAEVLGGFFRAAAKAVQSAWDAVVTFFQGIWDGIQAIFAVVADVLGGFFSVAVEAVKGAWEAIVDFFSGIWDGIQNVFSVVADVLGGFFSAAAEAVQAAWEAVSEFFAGVWEAIQGVFSNVAEVLGGFFRAAWEAVKTVWTAAAEFFSGVADGIRSVFETVTQFLGEAFSAAWQAVSNAWSAATEFFSGIWETISSLFGGAAEWFGGIFSAAWSAITSAWDGVGEFFKGVWDSITGVFKDAFNHFKEIGGNIVNGIKDGISNAWKNLTSWVSGLFGDLVKSVKSTLGIHSPSTVFAGIGGNMALGLGEGWNAEYSAIKAKIENGMNFSAGTATLSLATNGGGYGGAAYGKIGQGNLLDDAGAGTTNNFNFTFNSPAAMDPVTAEKEAEKAAQRIALVL